MNPKRNRPTSVPVDKLDIWFSEVINDAIRDAEEAGFPTPSICRMLLFYAVSASSRGTLTATTLREWLKDLTTPV